jgi:hypothetical protein
MVGEMAAWLRRSNIDHAQLMLNDYWTEQWRSPHKIISGFRFLTEAEATMFWLHYQGNDD